MGADDKKTAPDISFWVVVKYSNIFLEFSPRKLGKMNPF